MASCSFFVGLCGCLLRDDASLNLSNILLVCYLVLSGIMGLRQPRWGLDRTSYFFLFIVLLRMNYPSYFVSRVERKTGVSQMVVFPQT